MNYSRLRTLTAARPLPTLRASRPSIASTHQPSDVRSPVVPPVSGSRVTPRGVGDGGGVGDGVGDGVGAGVWVAGSGVGLGVGEGVGDGVGLTVGEGVGDGVGLDDGVGEGEDDGVGLGVGEGVGDGVGDGVGLGVGLGDGVGDGLGVGVSTQTSASSESVTGGPSGGSPVTVAMFVLVEPHSGEPGMFCGAESTVTHWPIPRSGTETVKSSPGAPGVPWSSVTETFVSGVSPVLQTS